MTQGWLPPDEYRRAQQTLPISCVDVLPLQYTESRKVRAIGLIFRDTPHQGERWCLVGGRMLYGESFGKAVRRQLTDTLGKNINFEIAPTSQPMYVAQYRPFIGDGFQLDPRQHAIGLTYCIEIFGEPRAQGEASAFDWFEPKALPQPQEFGFQQDRVVAACLKRLPIVLQ
jgi:ADP-ribose pyrophosphatase YjhB (NUDIX family)